MITGGYFAFKGFYKPVPKLTPDPDLVDGIKTVAEELGLPMSQIRDKIALCDSHKELLNFSVDLNRDLLIKRIHVVDSGFLSISAQAGSWLTFQNLVCLVAFYTLASYLYSRRRVFGAFIANEIKTFFKM